MVVEGLLNEININESELETARKEAYSIKGSSSGMNYVGNVENNGKVNMFWKDKEGLYWFQTYFRVKDKLITEEEHMFGKKIIKQRRSWISAE